MLKRFKQYNYIFFAFFKTIFSFSHAATLDVKSEFKNNKSGKNMGSPLPQKTILIPLHLRKRGFFDLVKCLQKWGNMGKKWTKRSSKALPNLTSKSRSAIYFILPQNWTLVGIWSLDIASQKNGGWRGGGGISEKKRFLIAKYYRICQLNFPFPPSKIVGCKKFFTW